MGKRIEFIDVAKGIAIISIIAGHLKFGQGSFDPIARLVFQYHVPLFFIVAGCFLSKRGTNLSFIRDKARRLLVPYAYACVVMLLVLLAYQLLLGTTNPPSLFNSLRSYLVAALYGAGSDAAILPEGVVSIGAIWYLEALFVALVEVRLCRQLGRWEGPVVVALAAAACLSARYFFLPFNLQSGLLGGFFVYLGGLMRTQGLLERPFSLKVVIPCALISALAYYFDITISITRLYLGKYGLGVIVALTSSLLALQLSRLIAEHTKYLRGVLEFYGAHSLVVFVAHLILLNMGFKWALLKLTGINPDAKNLIFCINFPLQLAITAGAALLAQRAPIARRVFYPSRSAHRSANAGRDASGGGKHAPGVTQVASDPLPIVSSASTSPDLVSHGNSGSPSSDSTRAGMPAPAPAPRRPLLAEMLVCLVAAATLSVVAEFCLFNIPHWVSLGFGPTQQVPYTTGTLTNDEGDDEQEQHYVEFDCEDTHVDNIALELEAKPVKTDDPAVSPGCVIPLRVYATDAGNTEKIRLSETHYVGNIEATHYVRVHLSGGSRIITIVFTDAAQEVTVHGITINTQHPLLFSRKRMLVAFIALLLALLLRPSSKLYDVPFDPSSRLIACIVVIALMASGLGMAMVTRMSHRFAASDIYEPIDTHDGYLRDFGQYNRLADAFISGRLSIDLPVAETLKNLDNPYDRNTRNNAAMEADEHVYLDYAYHDGSYYSYFGALPALVFFVPYKLLTGTDLATHHLVTLLAYCTALSVGWLMTSLYLRYFRHGSVGMWLLSILSAIACGGMIGLAYYPSFYSIPSLCALALACAALSCWLGAAREDGSLHRGRLFAGGLLLALTLGCRPQFIVCCLLAFPIFWNEIVEDRAFFAADRDAMINTLLVMGPFILVALPVMLYNYARFGSFFDFGATYNITGSDMTHRDFVLARICYSTFHYLFQPPALDSAFPFFHAVSMNTDYQGFNFYEIYLGGFLSFAPLCLMLATGLSAKRALRTRQVSGLCLTLVLIGLITMVLDFEVASITSRYFCDFGWLLMAATWLVIWSIMEDETQTSTLRKPFIALVAILVIVGLLVNGIALFSDDRFGCMRTYNPELFYQVKTWFTAFL